MRNGILIVESNVYRLITLKHFISSEFRISVNIAIADTEEQAMTKLATCKPSNVIFVTSSGLEGVVEILKKKKVNRLNSEITLLATRDEEMGAVTKRRSKFLENGQTEPGHLLGLAG